MSSTSSVRQPKEESKLKLNGLSEGDGQPADKQFEDAATNETPDPGRSEGKTVKEKNRRRKKRKRAVSCLAWWIFMSG